MIGRNTRQMNKNLGIKNEAHKTDKKRESTVQIKTGPNGNCL